MARPTDLNPEVAAELCRRVAARGSLRSVCRDEDMPGRTTVYEWIIADKEFADQYARAKSAGVDELAEEAIEIADTPMVGRKVKTTPGAQGTEEGALPEPDVVEVTEGDMTDHRRLRVDIRKWYVGKVAPKLYGERVAHEHTGADGGPIQITDDRMLVAKIEALYAAAARMRDTGSDLV